METSYFLGANSARGFCSLYEGFGSARGAYLSIIKGGPGTGKSGLMRAIGREAVHRGYDVEYVLCSGDPDSLDGLLIPALGRAWCDGTAPHVSEPAAFGVDGEYLNVGQFCRTPLPEAERQRVLSLSGAYKGRYAHAYALLAAARETERALSPAPCSPVEQERAGEVLRALCGRLAPPQLEKGVLLRRFAGAISCRGVLRLSESFERCKLIYCCEDGCGLAGGALRMLRDEALGRTALVIEYLSPLDASTIDALLLPELSAVFVRGSLAVPHARRIALDRLAGDLESVKQRRREKRAARRDAERYIQAACGALSEAKALHDELEAVYKPFMDYAALDAFTAREIRRVFA